MHEARQNASVRNEGRIVGFFFKHILAATQPVGHPFGQPGSMCVRGCVAVGVVSLAFFSQEQRQDASSLTLNDMGRHGASRTNSKAARLECVLLLNWCGSLSGTGSSARQ